MVTSSLAHSCLDEGVWLDGRAEEQACPNVDREAHRLSLEQMLASGNMSNPRLRLSASLHPTGQFGRGRKGRN